MPIYEYACKQCGKITDVLQKMSDPPPQKCGACGAEGPMEKMVSRTSFVLKGGGWYSDLYGSKKKDSSSSSSDSGSGSGSSGSGSGSGDKSSAAAGSSSGASTSTSTPAASSSSSSSSSSSEKK